MRAKAPWSCKLERKAGDAETPMTEAYLPGANKLNKPVVPRRAAERG
jgi:hypothetical protein